MGAGGATDPEPVTPERDALALHELEGTIDLVIADPHRTYAASVTGVAQALRLLRPGGLVLMHDCLPPPDLMGPEFRHGSWCGESYAAFRDVCTAHGLPWFTINADFGIGVVTAAAPNPGRVAAPTLPDHDAVRSRQTYLADPYAFMRAVAPSDADVAIARLTAGEPVVDLIEVFDGWDEAPTAHDEFGGELVDARIAVKLLSQQNEMLRRELAATRATPGREQVTSQNRAVGREHGMQTLHGLVHVRRRLQRRPHLRPGAVQERTADGGEVQHEQTVGACFGDDQVVRQEENHASPWLRPAVVGNVELWGMWRSSLYYRLLNEGVRERLDGWHSACIVEAIDIPVLHMIDIIASEALGHPANRDQLLRAWASHPHRHHSVAASRVRRVPFAGRTVPVLDCTSLAVFKAMLGGGRRELPSDTGVVPELDRTGHADRRP